MDDIFNLDDSCAAPIYNNTQHLMPESPWLEQLNPEQKLAVKTTEGPVLVLSGAGTGKTKVLTTRLAYILSQQKAQPWNCLVVTFTNRAAKEMKERVRNLIGPMADSVWLGTFHSICVKILRVHASLVGLNSNFTILAEDDQKRVIKKICADMGVDDKKYPPQSIVDRIQRWKDKNITVDKIDENFKSNTLTEIYKRYQQRLLELNCVDFGDILLYTLTILMSNDDVLRQYQEKFRYIMVDEYQDTNVTQYLFLRLLSQKYRNLCCVGDDDQSIYSWRGAEIENILRFEKDFKDCTTIRLERNYRSTANILAAASCLISHNSGRLGKTLKVAENSPARGSDNCPIKIISTYNGEDEAQYVMDEIENLHRNGYEYSQMAVLVRTAFHTREFEEKFIAVAIPYQVIGGPKFYERAEIRDALAYFRVILQPHDDLAFERIINKPARGVGEKTLDKMRDFASREQCSLFDAAARMVEQGGLSGKAKANLSELVRNFEEWRHILPAVSPDDLAAQVLEDSGYVDMLKNDSSPDAEGRLENLKELISVLTDKNKYPNLSEFLEHVSLVMDNDEALDANKVMLITLHSAKGLEFDVVFLPGWEEGLFPHQRSLDEGGENALEEERRLAYVAITRAKQKLYILTAMNRRVYGQWQNNIPSRFINELPPQNIELCNNVNQFYSNYIDNREPQQNYGNNYQNSYGNNNRQGYQPWYRNKRPSYSQQSAAQKQFIGAKVYHDTFGFGKVTNAEGNKLEIKFDNYGIKKVHKDYVTKV